MSDRFGYFVGHTVFSSFWHQDFECREFGIRTSCFVPRNRGAVPCLVWAIFSSLVIFWCHCIFKKNCIRIVGGASLAFCRQIWPSNIFYQLHACFRDFLRHKFFETFHPFFQFSKIFSFFSRPRTRANFPNWPDFFTRIAAFFFTQNAPKTRFLGPENSGAGKFSPRSKSAGERKSLRRCVLAHNGTLDCGIDVKSVLESREPVGQTFWSLQQLDL